MDAMITPTVPLIPASLARTRLSDGPLSATGRALRVTESVRRITVGTDVFAGGRPRNSVRSDRADGGGPAGGTSINRAASCSGTLRTEPVVLDRVSELRANAPTRISGTPPVNSDVRRRPLAAPSRGDLAAMAFVSRA